MNRRWTMFLSAAFALCLALPAGAQTARITSPTEAAAAEASLKNDPENVKLRTQLIYFYQWSTPEHPSTDQDRAAARSHLLWLIRNHPESAAMAGRSSSLASPSKEPDAYRELASAWHEQADKPDASVVTLRGAASLFYTSDPEYAESLLLRALESNPKDRPAATFLGQTYALAALGITEEARPGARIVFSEERAKSDFARKARTQIETTNLAAICGVAGERLTGLAEMPGREFKLDFDPFELGEKALARAPRLDPPSAEWPNAQIMIWERKALRAKSPAEQRALRLRALEACDRSVSLTTAAVAAGQSNSLFLQNGSLSQGVRIAMMIGDWDRAERMATSLLRTAEALPQSGDRAKSEALRTAHAALGRVALRSGDLARAKSELLASARVPFVDTIINFPPDMSLAKELLALDQRDVVAQYLAECKRILPKVADDFNAWIASLQEGGTPPLMHMVDQRAVTSQFAGKPAPEFEIKDFAGKPYTPAALKGKVVLLDFWATWCAPCREELPHLNKISDEFSKDGLVMIGVDANEDKETIDNFLRKTPLKYPVALGEGNPILKRYQIEAFPTVVIIDREGKVAHYDIGSGSEDRLRFALAKAGIGKAPEGYVDHATPATTVVQAKTATWPVIKHRAAPVYPEEARRAKVSGTVVLSVLVGADGMVEEANVAHGVGFGLDESAMSGLKDWRFEPATRDGKPVPVRMQVEVPFRQPDREGRLRPARLTFINEGVSKPVLIEGEAPVAPGLLPGEELRISFNVTAEGRIDRIRLEGEDPGGADAALEAVRNWRFTPAQRNGKPSEISGLLTIQR